MESNIIILKENIIIDYASEISFSEKTPLAQTKAKITK